MRQVDCTSFYPKEELGSAPFDVEQVNEARAELERAESRGFLYCEAVFVLGKFDGLCEKAHPTDDSLAWGRGQNVTKRNFFREGKLVRDPTRQPPPPLKRWGAHGLQCEVRENGIGYPCGYVAVPEGHPWHGVGYNQCLRAGCTEEYHYECTPGARVEVHGGLTYAGKSWGADEWWFGFDCAHCDDAPSPEYQAKELLELGRIFDPDGHYWTPDEVMAETERLAKQLAAVTTPA